MILKMRSAFFRKFLDSPGKLVSSDTSGSKKDFKYEWVTKVDEDGTWGLVAASSQEKTATAYDSIFAEYQTETFSNLLHAMYTKPYEILEAREVIELTEMADYYCALPIVSATIGFPISIAGGKIDIQYYCVNMIMPAFKLRHRHLFRECVVYLAGNWDPTDEVDSPSWDQKVKNVVIKARERIRLQIEKVHEIILKLSAEYPFVAQALSEVQPYAGHPLPNYYRRLKTAIEEGTPASEFRDILYKLHYSMNPLLHNCLQFPAHYCQAGEDYYENYFLCAKVEGNDVPWDITQSDW
ncbi:hypothetical protein EG329_006024 [Mollisiaceae sp. DMI_Dod_QoI]|nr:hypothetical protein EG329_006024 [Helotiales sp. DMI_Dod_QoI]